MTTIYFAGGEDSDFRVNGNITVSTSTSTFRSAFARVSLAPTVASSAGPATVSGFGIENPTPFSLSSFWLGYRFTPNLVAGFPLLSFLDSSRIQRLQLRAGSLTASSVELWKGDSSGTFTQIVSSSPSGLTNSVVHKIDMFVNYATTGQISLYVDGNLIFNFIGDPTTNSITSLASFVIAGTGNISEVICADIDTRSMSLQTFAPVANGNTHTFDTGTPAAANVNETTLSDLTLDGSSVANQLDQYTNAAVAAGTFDVVSFGVSARAQKGTSGPSKIDLNVRTGGTDYFSADIPLTTAFAPYQNWWNTNPNTSAAWTTAQIGNASGFNIGVKSIT